VVPKDLVVRLASALASPVHRLGLVFLSVVETLLTSRVQLLLLPARVHSTVGMSLWSVAPEQMVWAEVSRWYLEPAAPVAAAMCAWLL
jgi:hypothetical protein